ncbi:MFS transporter [Rhizobium sp.]|jgi:MFS transporter, SET family, sugar efflux transporter|uniref:MFS transporter n=1 Tax=Rhizobium sp. TaxID=391 RepID=UPI000E7ED87E|nr:MFS transporter [Rhizobium sp.]
MLPSLSAILHNPGVRVSAISIFFFGLTGATTAPFLSLIGIHELGLSNAHYSLLIFVASCINVVASVAIGVLADRMGHFRMPMLIVSLFGVVGYGAVYLLPNQLVFVLCALCCLPIFGALNSLIFANVRSASSGMPLKDLVAVNAGVRAIISASWVLVPGVVGFFLAEQPSMLPAFLYACLGALACFFLYLLFLPKAEPTTPTAHGGRFMASIFEVANTGLLLRLLAVALISTMMQMNGVVLPLVITGPAHGTNADVGITVGIVAFLEIVFILFWGVVERRTSAVFTLTLGAAIYCSYLMLVGFAATPMHIYLLTPIAGLGAAAIISVPISYLQNLIADRAGLGSSLIAVNMFLSGGLNSLVFALGTKIGDYSFTAKLGAVVGLCGIVLMLLMEKPVGRKIGRH